MSNRVLVVGISAVLSMTVMVVPALAQQIPPWGPPLPCLPFEPENSIEWPSGSEYGSAAGFGRLVLAELNGDDAPEAIVLAGGIPVVLWKVSIYDVALPITFSGPADDPIAVTDITVLPGHGPDGTDALAMSDGRGLFIVTHTGNGVFPDPDVPAPTWTNAFKLHTEDVDNDGDLDILGASSNKRSVLKALWNGTSFVPQDPITVVADILDLTMVNWDGSLPIPGQGSTREMAVLTKRALFLYWPSGTLFFQQPYLSSTGCIARFHANDVQGGERLAWTRRITPNSPASQLVICGLDQVLEGPWTLDFDLPCNGSPVTIQPTALLAGNYDGNVNDELLLVHETNHTAIVLANLANPEAPVASHFDVDDTAWFDIVALSGSALAPADIGIPAFDDADNEEPDDLVFPVASTGFVEVFTSLPKHRTGSTIGFNNSAEIIMEHSEYGPGDATSPGGTLRLAFHVTQRYQAYTHVDMIIWHQPDADADTDTVPLAVYNTRWPLELEGQDDAFDFQFVSIRPDIPELAYPPEGFPDDECWIEPKRYFFPEFRFLKINAQGTILAQSRFFAGGFCLVTCGDGPGQGEDTNFNHLISQGIPGSIFDLFEDTILPNASSRQLLGAFVPMNGVPYFGDGPQPSRGPLTNSPTPATHYEFEQ